MVESDVLHATFLTGRRLVAFFAVGALLLLGKRTWLEPWQEPPLPALQVRVPKDAVPIEIERATERATLAAYAIEHGALEADPVVTQRLREDLGADVTADALAELGRSLRIERVDPMLQERLSWHGEQLLRARVAVPAPSERALQDYLDAHANRYHTPARYSLTQILISSRRGPEQATRVAEVQAELARGMDVHQAQALSDASILPRTLSDVTLAELDESFGPGFGEAVSAIPAQTFSGPIAGRYGTHFVWVAARSEARTPRLSAVRARVLADYLSDARGDATARAVKGLAARYRVVVVREGT